MRFILPALFALPSSIIAQPYFQQQVDYTIEVRLDDVRHMLFAQEKFVYTNNSTTTLDTLWMHLWPNAYRDRTTALCDQLDRIGDLKLHFATGQERGWIDSLDFRSSDAKLTWGLHTKHADIGWIKLPAPLPPGASITITTPFRVKIPDGKFSRLGHSKQAYYITQWYPKPAVFDAQGWHAMPYLTEGEFYSEFGSFDVSITVPANYVVGATGELQNAEERAWMDSLAMDRSAQRGTTPLAKPNDFPPSDAATKTLRFKQDRVHDFGWFADKRFLVRKSSVFLPRSARTVTTWVLFTPKNRVVWEEGVTYVNEAVKRYSQWVGDYPYSACTAVDGTIAAGGGMEYPMITVIGDTDDAIGLDEVITHEVGHNWFYGILGSNERDHAWMDEGVNSFNEMRYMRERYPGSSFSIGIPFFKKLTAGITDVHRAQNELGYRLNARRGLDQPIDITSNDLTEINYGTMVYMKTALVFDHLFAYLGDEVFDKCMRAYYDEWGFKHPQPGDMRKVFERESGKDLGWVFEEGIASARKGDIKAVELSGQQLTYRTSTTSPFPVSGWRGNDSLGTIWTENGAPEWWRPKRVTRPRIDGRSHALVRVKGKGELTVPWPDADRIRIDAGNRTLDIDRRNNSVRSTGLFKRCAPPKLEPYFGSEKQDRRSIYYSVVPAWNGHDGFQAGLVLRNTTFPSQRTEWVVAPLYAFGSERLVGGARIEHHFDRLRSNLFQNIHIGLSGRTSGTFNDDDVVAWYEKVSPYVTFDLKRDPLVRPWQHTIGLRGVYVRNTAEYEHEGDLTYRSSDDEFYAEIFYRAEDERKLHPSLVQPTITSTYDWVRAAIELKQAFAYNERNKQLRLRGFFGSYLWERDGARINNLQAWGLTWGPEDMQYDQAYFERGATDGGTSRQFSKQQGAFKTPFRAGGSDTWIASANVELDLPFSLPIALFASAGVVPSKVVTVDGSSSSTASYFEAGVGIPVMRDVFEIWFPLYVSDRIQEEEDFAGRTVSDRIRFVFALEKMDPTQLLRKLKP
ncbi:MAG: M1 family metallopeptidase [Flavobacteriales bacterium]